MQLALAFAAFSIAAAASASNIRATVNGEYITFPDVQPIMINNRVMVPVRGVFEHLNADVTWDERTQTVTAIRGTDNIKCVINSTVATVNGREVALDSPVRSLRGRTMVPLRFLSESLDATVAWMEDSRTVDIRTVSAISTGVLTTLDSGTVIPFSLLNGLTSDRSRVGDPFTAALELTDDTTYLGIPETAILSGEVEVARAKTDKVPGVLGLKFNSIKFSNGRTYALRGTLIGLDEKSITNENGKITTSKRTRRAMLCWRREPNSELP
ncbi:MAG: copper amine oxidase N-terminal domain-containing protein [Armatimonadetes bacterium]|nr:copper amine oxidase N-terminal domain-containing protein [Armatimonadota bacterium]